MRKELELMETIDNYLKGKLSDADKTAFEKKINADPGLKKEVELQKQLLKGIERTGLKQSAKQAGKKYKFNRNLRNWGLTGLSVAVIALASVFVYKSFSKPTHKENAPYDLPELNEQGEKLWSDADKYLEPQLFDLNPEKDTVVETKDGIVIAIPAHSFLDRSGKPASGAIKLEVKEALNATDIMKAGLNTKSGDKLLETGGMFYINARQGDASLKIDPKNALYAEVPTNEVKPNMQLFEGKRMPDGTIDWVNPKPIRKDLIPVDITSLDFYPPNYLDSVKAFGYNNKDKKFTDSLYYSFASLFGTLPELSDRRLVYGDNDFDYSGAKGDTTKSKSLSSQLGETEPNPGERIFRQNCAVCHSLGNEVITGPGLAGVFARVPSVDWMKKYIRNNVELKKSGDPYAVDLSKTWQKPMTVFTNLSDDEINSVVSYIRDGDRSVSMSNRSGMEGPGGINPAAVKAIWNEKFNNTLLSTREFEERMPLIHNTCDENVLDTYIDNIDKDLSAIDSAVMTQHPEFSKFAARGDGKVKNGNKNVELLKRYYAEKSKIYTEAIAKTVNDFYAGQAKKDQEAENKKEEYKTTEANRIADNFQQELDKNLDEAYRQLGYERPGKSPMSTSRGQIIPPPSYGMPIVNSGWCNIDSYTLAATANRTPIDYTDKETGKRAVIKYEPLIVTVNNINNYDRVLVYLLPEELSSFMRMPNNNGKFEEKLNELMTYKMICLAYKGEESFYYSQDNIKPGSASVSMVKTTNEVIQNNINQLSRSHSKAMNDELAYMAFEKEDAKRKAYVAKVEELTSKVRPVIFPCTTQYISADSVDMSASNEMKKFVSIDGVYF